MEGTANTTSRNAVAWGSGLLGVAVGVALTTFWSAKDSHSLSSRELTTALGMHHFRYVIPKNDGTRFLTFVLRDGESEKTHGGSSGWQSGENVLVTVRPLRDSRKLECSIIGKQTKGHFLLENPFASLSPLHYADDGALVNNQPMIKANREGAVTVIPINSKRPGDVSLWIEFEEPKGGPGE